MSSSQRAASSVLVFLSLATAPASPLAAQATDQLPIHLVYVNHVEVESVIDYVPPLIDGTTYTATPERYDFTSGWIDWEVSQAESAGARISFHMSGAFAERATAAGDGPLWAERLVNGHTAGVHFHKFVRGANPFEWAYLTSPSQSQIEGAWQDHHDLAADVVGSEALWIGESHYACASCWENLGYRLKTTEQMALLPTGEHIVWLVERDAQGTITYPHFPQIGTAGWHGGGTQSFFDLRLPQLQKELLLLYLEWLERERLELAPQVWCWGFANHGGPNTQVHADTIVAMLAWLEAGFAGRTSARGNTIARFVGDHELSDVYEAYERSGGQPLPPPSENIDDQFPYATWALADAGVTADLSADLGLAGVRLFELERVPPEGPPPASPPRVYLLFREDDGAGAVDIGAVLAARGMDPTRATLLDVADGSSAPVDPGDLQLGPTPMVLEASRASDALASPFGFHPASVQRAGYPDNGFVDAEAIGVRWHRPPLYAFWFLIQPNLGDPTYDWTLHDQQYGSVPAGMRVLANVAPQGRFDQGRCLPGSWVPIDVPQYAAFVHATVERYDGDGVDDMPGLASPIRHWQVGNEPNDLETSDFDELQRITYLAIKQAAPESSVLIGGVAGFPAGYVADFDVRYAPILERLSGGFVDALDFHWYGTAGGEYRLVDTLTSEDVLAHVRATLLGAGFAPDLPLWITEMGSYSGAPQGPFPPQSERQQAGDVFKRFVFPLARGVSKVFPAFGLMEGFMHDDGYFDHTGLIYDGAGSGDLGLGVKKLGYYTYARMTAGLEGADWSTLALLHDGTGTDHLYLASVERDGRTVHAAWWDTFDEPGYVEGDTKPITIAGLTTPTAAVTDLVPDYAAGIDVPGYEGAFTTVIHVVEAGELTIDLGEDPVLVVPVEEDDVLTWCRAKPSSAGCLPLIGFEGAPSATSPSPFLVRASDVINNKPGLLFYGFAPAFVPFQDGTLCVAPPIARTPVQFSGGNPPPPDCSGSYVFDFNAWIQAGPDPALVPGTAVYAQYWYRDPASASHTGLSDAIAFTVGP